MLCAATSINVQITHHNARCTMYCYVVNIFTTLVRLDMYQKKIAHTCNHYCAIINISGIYILDTYLHY